MIFLFPDRLAQIMDLFQEFLLCTVQTQHNELIAAGPVDQISSDLFMDQLITAPDQGIAGDSFL